MGKTYYDSSLTDAQIQQVLDAINNILTPSNNGKGLAINGGTLEARSVQWGGGYPEPTGTILLTQNGMHDVKDYAGANVQVQGGGSDIEVIPLSVTENNTYTAPTGKAYSPVTVNVSGGGGDIKGFEVYAADAYGGTRTEQGFLDNQYFACFFDDNMSNTYTLNGASAIYSTLATGKTGTNGLKATTRDVANPSPTTINAVVPRRGSAFTASHIDSGSYISVVGGWVGYPGGGTIYESAAVGTSNSVTLNSAHETLLIFIGADSNASGITTVDLNGATYTIENIGSHYSAYGMYTAIEINGNTDTSITVTFPASCWSYVSVIGIDS